MKVLFIIDDPNTLKTYKDTSYAFMVEAQNRKHEVYICQQQQLQYREDNVFAHTMLISVDEKKTPWYQVLSENKQHNLSGFDLIMMRKDPPFNLNYIYTTYLLELLENKGVLVINKPQSLRDCNEKAFTLQFPQCIPPVQVTALKENIVAFVATHKECVLKPLDGMAGKAIYKTHSKDQNLPVIIEMWTKDQTVPIMVQKFIPEIKNGDKRILLINGEPVAYALYRIPHKGEIRGNLAAGGTGKGAQLNDRDRWICQQLSPTLKAKGLVFVGIDVIGDYLTEINVTSPTCVREIDEAFDINISAQFFDCVEALRDKG